MNRLANIEKGAKLSMNQSNIGWNENIFGSWIKFNALGVFFFFLREINCKRNKKKKIISESLKIANKDVWAISIADFYQHRL